MKDKIIEILKEFSVMSTGHDDYYYTIPGSKLKDAAIAIDSLYPTLNRDKVMEVAYKIIMNNSCYECRC
jgi:hypothetical protein